MPLRVKLVATWGVLGVVAMLVQALWRLTPVALEPILAGQLSAWHWMLYGAWVAVSIHAEGYRGFHKNFSPRVVARAIHLGQDRQVLHVLVAPVYCMGLIHATRRRLVVSWALLVAIVLLVIWVRTLEQPWRGIIDGGVVVGLFLGTLSLLYFYWRGLAGDKMPVDPDLPK